MVALPVGLELLDLSAGSQRRRRHSSHLGRAGFEPARTFSASPTWLLLCLCQHHSGNAGLVLLLRISDSFSENVALGKA